MNSPIFFFFLAFAVYMITAAREMNNVVLFAAVEFGHQGSADRPHVFSCSFMKGASLQNMLCGL